MITQTAFEKIKKYGIAGSAQKVFTLIGKRGSHLYFRWMVRHAPQYKNPTPDQLIIIEQELHQLGVIVQNYAPSIESFKAFQAEQYFPLDYHGGINGSVWDEKLLEHWIAAQRLGLMDYQPSDIYVDVAAGGSPWAKVLREHLGISAFAIDMGPVSAGYRGLEYYRTENATATSFENSSVKGASLHCAYEMFTKDDDTKLLNEIKRTLKPGGKVVILPLYMHTHYCAYSTPEYYGKGYSDPSATEYVRLDCFGIPSSRKYDAQTLKNRVLDRIEQLGMRYQLLVLRNKDELGENIYCHFILEIIR